MKRPVSALVGLALVVVLGFLAYRELRQEKQSGVMKAGDLVFPYNQARIEGLDFLSEGRRATFRRAAPGWEQTKGDPAADPAFVSDFLGAWSRVRFLQEVEEAPSAAALKEYGLDPPRAAAGALLAPGEGQEGEAAGPRIELGNPSPLVAALYARLDGRPRVVLVNADAMELIEGVGREILGGKANRPESRPSPFGKEGLPQPR